MKITEISIKRTTIPVVIFTLLALTGIFSYTLLNKELSPAMDLPINVVMTIYPGAAPSEVENSVTKPIEEAISSLEGIDKITAYSAEGMSALMVQYKDGIDADISLQEAERKVNMIKDSQLPANCNDPQFIKYDMNMFPVMSIAVNANLPETEFYNIIDKEIKTRLSQIKGAAQVEILGGNEREIEIKANAILCF